MSRYPIGKQDFKSLREGNFIYIDKTHYIPLLLEGSQYYFLSRPRRFGKSLFLSTLEYFFLGERDLFKGLAIDSFDWDWQPWPVIHIDLNGANYTEPISLKSRLTQNLLFIEGQYKIDSTPDLLPAERFRNLIISLFNKFGRQVVVLVDEYEKPILDTLDYPEQSESHKEMLRGFYGVLKSMDNYLKLVFLTGVTKFGQMNVFSGLNNIRDISLNHEYGAICGITKEELLENFQEGIEKIAVNRRTDREGALSLLKKNYDGYHFSEDCPDIYNPFSLLNAFADGKIGAYWAYTGTPSLLARVLSQGKFDIRRLEGIKVDEARLIGIGRQFTDPVTLFYQTGYLTIKGYDWEDELYTLGYPNREVEQAFFDYLLPNFSGVNVMESNSFLDDFREALENGEPQKAMETLEEFSASISYDVVPKAETERHFHYLIYIISKLLLGRRNIVKVEEKTSDGRIDLLIATKEFIYVIEIKKDSSPEEALAQIKRKEYALQFRGDSRKIFLIGMNFSTEKRRLDGFLVE